MEINPPFRERMGTLKFPKSKGANSSASRFGADKDIPFLGRGNRKPQSKKNIMNRKRGR